MKLCSIESCGNPVRRRGWCAKHYWRWTKYGDPLTLKRADSEFDDEQRLRHHGWDVTESGCWEFRGSKRGGYGSLQDQTGKIVPTHRLAYKTWVGAIPEGLQINHKCDNPPCINPAHLYAGTHAQNMLDRTARNRQYRPNTRAKLDASAVEHIRSALEAGTSGADLAAKYGVAPRTIRNIRNGTTWKGV